MEILVFGAGSLGSLIGGLLARDHDVTLVGREPHVEAIEQSGLTIDGEIERTARPQATTTTPAEAELVIVTVKAYDTATAADALRDCECEVVLSVQNGIDNEATLADALDAQILAGTATYGAIAAEPGHVTCTGIGEVVLGDPDGGPNTVADRVGAAFRSAAIETTVATDMPRRLWTKLAVNAGINATTALAQVENGALAEEPARMVAHRAARETARVADRNGVALAEGDAVTALEAVIEATADNESSMYRDIQSEHRTEVDAINGIVADSDLETPVNETLAALVRTWERERTRRR
ncbi:ketopantoate reductase family protein [Halorhabdus sp. CBA1104]|uniref:ketopantoate reductase family protein n=1 Tax=Halorhabdus sp. CBA1104 TaxID=1380432 RepID=UPI0012B20103|nr:ketopantoate reductase family protein [Halorhabdus sp. CBA1104]QGN07328.1 ketopantoate reductase family protein [Halorhabdus sp. CBA1104]